MRAERRRAPADDDARERSTAAVARLPPTAVGAELVLHRSVRAVRERVVTERRSLPLDALSQDIPHGAVQAAQLVRVEAARNPQRMQPALPERLVDVDVPEAGDRSLVEERRLERRAPPLEALAEPCCRERAERLGAEARGEVRRELVLLEQLPRPEAADIAIADIRSIV